MFAIAFDLAVNNLRKFYGEPYNNACFEIGRMLRGYGFYNAQGSVYLTQSNDMSALFLAMEALKESRLVSQVGA